MEFKDCYQKRRSIRKYTGENIPAETMQKILTAGLWAPSGHNKKSCDLIVVRDKEKLESLSRSRALGAAFVSGADAVIVALGDTESSDTWIEDCCIAMTQMHLAATDLGVGSCWIQGRGRYAINPSSEEPVTEGVTTEAFVRELLDIPGKYAVESLLALGMPANSPAEHTAEDYDFGKIHYEMF